MPVSASSKGAADGGEIMHIWKIDGPTGVLPVDADSLEDAIENSADWLRSWLDNVTDEQLLLLMGCRVYSEPQSKPTSTELLGGVDRRCQPED